jgi:hypothetical protein
VAWFAAAGSGIDDEKQERRWNSGPAGTQNCFQDGQKQPSLAPPGFELFEPLQGKLRFRVKICPRERGTPRI